MTTAKGNPGNAATRAGATTRGEGDKPNGNKLVGGGLLAPPSHLFVTQTQIPTFERRPRYVWSFYLVRTDGSRQGFAPYDDKERLREDVRAVAARLGVPVTGKVARKLRLQRTALQIGGNPPFSPATRRSRQLRRLEGRLYAAHLSDRVWFENHPDRQFRARHATWAELVEQAVRSGQRYRSFGIEWLVVVRQIKPGIYFRRVIHSPGVRWPDELTELECRRLLFKPVSP